MCSNKTEKDKKNKAEKKADKEKFKKEKAELKDVDKYLIRKYIEAIKEAPEHFPKEITVEEVSYQPLTLGVTGTISQKKDSKVSRRDRLDHYEKLYRCYIDSYRAKTSRIATIVIIIASFLLIGGTVALCAFGPNIRGQENTSTIATTTTSSNTVVVGGYADRGSCRYTYFQESNNGKR